MGGWVCSTGVRAGCLSPSRQQLLHSASLASLDTSADRSGDHSGDLQHGPGVAMAVLLRCHFSDASFILPIFSGHPSFTSGSPFSSAISHTAVTAWRLRRRLALARHRPDDRRSWLGFVRPGRVSHGRTSQCFGGGHLPDIFPRPAPACRAPLPPCCPSLAPVESPHLARVRPSGPPSARPCGVCVCHVVPPNFGALGQSWSAAPPAGLLPRRVSPPVPALRRTPPDDGPSTRPHRVMAPSYSTTAHVSACAHTLEGRHGPSTECGLSPVAHHVAACHAVARGPRSQLLI